MALKKSELYSSLWSGCDELRGGMDASQYKDYVLVLLFVKYVSDKYAGQPYAAITIPPGASFADMVALKGSTNIGDDINKKILGPLAKANNLSDMPDFNDPAKLGDGKEKVDRLTNLIAIFENPALPPSLATRSSTRSRPAWTNSSRIGRPPPRRASKILRRTATRKRSSKRSPRIYSLRLRRRAPLLDRYDIYQHLMDYWAETMQDDCYLIAADGWREAAKPRLVVEDNNKKTKEKPDFVVGRKKYRAELIPSALVIARYFAKEQAAIEKRETDIAVLQQQMEELAEEHGGEGGLLEDAKNDKDKLTKISVAARLKEIKGDTDAADERKVQADYLALSEREATASSALKTAQENLMERVLQHYARLTEDDIKTLVVDDKWLATLAAAVQGELDRVSQTLTGRIRQLAERYATPLPQLTAEVATLARRVDEHLKKMGAVGK